MKVILFGSTGYVGAEVLRRCLDRPDITSIIAISRRAPAITHAKLTFIQHSDFSHYTDETLAHFAAAQACIYCLGTNFPVSPPELNRKMNFEYALDTARTFAALARGKQNAGEPGAGAFRFVYNSGALVEKDATARLWFLEKTRKMRGDIENALLQLQREQEKAESAPDATGSPAFEVLIARPGGVMPQGAVIRTWLGSWLAPAIMVGDLGVAMLELAVGGNRDEGTLVENERLIALGRGEA
ncbi:hypothetical protein LTR85_004258 [Meristemomyces frigidus]|nr:hypothetical protein LTR85_004258 [Meristemomyces frigidus]